MSSATIIGRDKETRRTTSLPIYLKEINKIALLSRMEEDSLARRAAKGDPLAREKLIQANLRFVVKVAKQFHTQRLPLEDLISEGNIGLIRALEHFDPEKGYHFISYAVWWIRQAILRAIGEKSRLIRLPMHKADQLLQIAKMREDLLGEPCPASKVDIIAKRLHCDRGSLIELLNISRRLSSLEVVCGVEDDFPHLEDLIEDKNNSLPEELVIEKSIRDDINAALSSLSQRESEILQCHYGLNGKRPMTLQEIGNKCTLTRERIRQIEKKAIKRLRHPSRSNPLRGCL